MDVSANVSPMVLQNSTTIGAGDLTLTAVNGWITFNSAFGTGSSNQFYYSIRNKDKSGGEYEIGLTYLSDASTLVRDGNQIVFASSNSNNPVTFTAGTKEIICSAPPHHYAKPPVPGFIIDNWYYHGYGLSENTSALALTLNKLFAIPFVCPARTVFTRMGVYVATAQASAIIRCAIYENTNQGPGDMLVDAGSIDASTTGEKELTISADLDVGTYWLGISGQDSGAAVSINRRGTFGLPFGTMTADGYGAFLEHADTQSGALPDPFGDFEIMDSTVTMYDVWLRKV